MRSIQLQCNLALQSGSDFLGTGNTQKGSFAKYFSHLAGFFIIEDRVYKTTTSFLRRRTVRTSSRCRWGFDSYFRDDMID